jgi:uncharacterized membrane protein
MESRVKIAGHPVHPMLIVFPLGLLATAVIFDVIHLISGNSQWALVAYYMIGAGVIGGFLAAPFGLLDWLAIPRGTRAKRVGLWHGLLNAATLLLFLLSWLLRRENAELPPTGAVVAGLAGIAISVIGAWLGGELVDRLGVGVDDGAHLDSPSSLTGSPAGAGLATISGAPSYTGSERRGSSSSSYTGLERRAGLR